MGLLDYNLDDPKTLGLLNAGLAMLGGSTMSRTPVNIGQILQSGLQSYTGTLEDFRKRKQQEEEAAQIAKLRDIQLQEHQLGLADREAKKQQAQKLQSLIQQYGNDYAGMVRAGVPYETAKQLADSQNLGLQEVARTLETEGAGGGKTISQYDRYGRSVGKPITAYIAPQLVDLGGKSQFVKPQAGLEFNKTLSPSEIAANQRVYAQLAQSERHFQSNQALKREEAGQKKREPMSATLQKELIESDDIEKSSKNVIDALSAAKDVNKKAYSGWGANVRAGIVSNLAGTEAADATVQLNNLISGQALENLKLIFGGNPTEGERKVLLDMQASPDKTPEQREAILNRAISLAEARGRYAKGKAKAIREGTYLSEGVQEIAKPQELSGWSIKRVD